MFDDAPAESAFVSFNYDTVLEGALARLGSAADYAVSRFEDKRSKSGGAPVPVYKLHGSSNWAYINRRGYRLALYDSYDKFFASHDPILVPPTWRKGEFSPLIEEIWRGAHAELAEATRICVIGYSAPPSDSHFSYLMASTLSQNPALYAMRVVDLWSGSGRGRAERRYSRMFAPLRRYGRLAVEGRGLVGFLFDKGFQRLGRGTAIKEVGWA